MKNIIICFLIFTSFTLSQTKTFHQDVVFKKGQDDIVRPFFSLDHPSGDVEVITITINKFDNTASANDRMMVHWWVSTTQFGSPNHTGTTGVSYTLGAGESSITSYNHAITDGNRQIKIHLGRESGQPSITLYLMCEVQGIVFASDSFTIIGV